MKTLTITLHLDNAAFCDPAEVGRILNAVAAAHWPHAAYTRTLRDINGNTCGTAAYAFDRPLPGGACPHCGDLLHRAVALDECGFEQVVCEACEQAFTIDPEDEYIQ